MSETIACLVILPVVVMLGLVAMMVSFVTYEPEDDEHSNKIYVYPEFKPLTEEQIKDIHSRGKITPAEKVKEWEALGLCAPGDAIGSVAFRCKKFGCCHDCLVDYASQNDEYTSVFDNLKVVNGEDTPIFSRINKDNDQNNND